MSPHEVLLGEYMKALEEEKAESPTYHFQQTAGLKASPAEIKKFRISAIERRIQEMKIQIQKDNQI